MISRAPVVRAVVGAAAAIVVVCLLPLDVPSCADAGEPAGSNTVCRLFMTADARGNLEPCGCSQGQFGGLARRATFLKGARRPGDLLVDLGNLGASTADADRVGWRFLLRALDDLGYDALVPGGADIALLDELRAESARLVRTKVVCANLLDARTGEPVFAPWILRRLSDGTRLALVGLTSEAQTPPEGVRINPVAESARDAIAHLRGLADRVVLMGWIEGRPTEALGREFDPAVVVSGGVPRGSPDLLRRGGAPMMLVAERAQYVGEVEFGANAAALRGSLHWLGTDVGDDPDAARLVERWKDAVKPFAVPKIRELLAGFRAEGRIGSAACRECHETVHATWASSAHSRAMRTLASAHEDRNPTCLRCHFQDIAPADLAARADLDAGVGCEACHGGAARHATQRRLASPKVERLPKVEAAACTACHDAERSPKFEFAAFWLRIEHGGAAQGTSR